MSEPIYGSRYMHAEDLIRENKWSELRDLEISAFHPKKTLWLDDNPKTKKKIPKPCLEFSNHPKRLIIGATNERLLAHATGAVNRDEIIGRKITLYPVVGERWLEQNNTTGIRILVPDGYYMPHLQKKNLGINITGQTVSSQPMAQKKKAPADHINEIKSPKELTLKILDWYVKKPVADSVDVWRAIFRDVEKKIEAAGWERTDDRDKLISTVMELEKELPAITGKENQ